MKAYIAALTLLLPTAVAAQDASGRWLTETSDEGGSLVVRIGPCAAGSETVCGFIEEARNVPADAVAELTGKAIIWDMQPTGAGKWSRGRIWAPDDDKTYRSNMELTGAGLKVEGCVAVFCRGQTWTKLP